MYGVCATSPYIEMSVASLVQRMKHISWNKKVIHFTMVIWPSHIGGGHQITNPASIILKNNINRILYVLFVLWMMLCIYMYCSPWMNVCYHNFNAYILGSSAIEPWIELILNNESHCDQTWNEQKYPTYYMAADHNQIFSQLFARLKSVFDSDSLQ